MGRPKNTIIKMVCSCQISTICIVRAFSLKRLLTYVRLWDVTYSYSLRPMVFVDIGICNYFLDSC